MSTPSASRTGPREGLSAPTLRNFHLLLELVRRDFSMRFTGSALGVAWAVLHPLSLVLLYWFVFTKVFTASGGGAFRAADLAGGSGSYALFLISGLIPWMGMNEGILRGTTSIPENAALVRRLTFRSELLVMVPNLSAMLVELIGLGLLFLYLGISGSSLWSLWILPFALMLQLTLQIGLSWALATVNVFFRDVVQILGFVLSIVFYLSPILYAVPDKWAEFFKWNPLTPLFGLFRSAALGAPLPSPGSIVLLLVVAVTAFTLGLTLFRRAQPSLADLI